jgi:hypothetical protein
MVFSGEWLSRGKAVPREAPSHEESAIHHAVPFGIVADLKKSILPNLGVICSALPELPFSG